MKVLLDFWNLFLKYKSKHLEAKQDANTRPFPHNLTCPPPACGVPAFLVSRVLAPVSVMWKLSPCRLELLTLCSSLW